MKKLGVNIAVVVPFSKSVGGAFNYTEKLIDALSMLSQVSCINVVSINANMLYFNERYINNKKIVCTYYKKEIPIIRKSFEFINYYPGTNKSAINIINSLDPDIAICTAPWTDGFYTYVKKRIVIVHDLYHFNDCSKYDFITEQRDRGKNTIDMCSKAEKIICESAITKMKIQNLGLAFNFDSIKTTTLPLPPGFSLSDVDQDLKPTHLTPNDFWFAPSHICAFKNQEVILKAISLLKRNGIIQNVIFAFPSFSPAYLIKLIILAAKLNVLKNIKFMYKTPNKLMPYLYLNCQGVIMSSKMGPTNMPIVEAIEFGKPCLATYESSAGYDSSYPITRFHSDDFEMLASKIAESRGNSIKKMSPSPSEIFRDSLAKLFVYI